MKEYKVIFHIDEMNKWKLLLTNVYNLKQAIKNDFITIEVLANSEAVKFFVQTTFTESDLLKVRGLIKSGVIFCACNNSLLSNKIDPKLLLKDVIVVPSGVAELMIKQHESYAYIKP